jgi:hypothetical protein
MRPDVLMIGQEELTGRWLIGHKTHARVAGAIPLVVFTSI